MPAELVSGTANTLIIALILIVVLCVYRLALRAFDPALVAVVWFVLVIWLLTVS